MGGSGAPSLRVPLEIGGHWSAETRHVRGRALWIDLETAQRPSSGECIVGAYWSVHPERGVAFYYQPFGYARSEEPSPQCNYHESTSRLLTERGWPDHECRHIPVVYLTHARRAMAADKQALVSNRKDGSSPQNQEPSQ